MDTELKLLLQQVCLNACSSCAAVLVAMPLLQQVCLYASSSYCSCCFSRYACMPALATIAAATASAGMPVCLL